MCIVHCELCIEYMQNFLHDKQFGDIVAGVDEAGRGPLAGPVVCAVCIMGDVVVEGINDSKQVSKTNLQKLYKEIIKSALEYHVVALDNNIIDDINILNATKKGMMEAISKLQHKPQKILIDHVKLDVPDSISITKGDSLSYNIAAASILAKVSRDNMMHMYSLLYPEYGFEQHKGYPTKAHYQAIQKYGILPIHRMSFLKKLSSIHNSQFSILN